MIRLDTLIPLTIMALAIGSADAEPAIDLPPDSVLQDYVESFCIACHEGSDAEADVDLSQLAISVPLAERIHRKIVSGQMPPRESEQPGGAATGGALEQLEQSIDRVAQEYPSLGHVEPFRRLTRLEYQNVVRDLLSLRIDAATLLPKDQSSRGFDNITVAELSPALLSRYVSAAQKISRLVVGNTGSGPGGRTIRVPADVTQEDHIDGLPLGTRGGVVFEHHFPRSGTYKVRVRLARDRNEEVEGMRGEHQLEILLDRKHQASFTVNRPKGADHSKVDAHLVAEIKVPAGSHRVGVTFVKQSASLLETKREPYQSRFNTHRHPRTKPAVFQVSVTGPHDETGDPAAELAARLLVSPASEASGDVRVASQNALRRLARLAWRSPVSEKELSTAMRFFDNGLREGGFVAAMESAIASLLVNPRFLFRIERTPHGVAPGEIYEISEFELATRLSFFLWSSLPDHELLELAESGKLREAGVLSQQVRRMLGDPRSDSLVRNFAGQWLYLRNLGSITPDARRYPDFDENLRQAMRRETELFFESILREDRSVLDLLSADYTFLNERLAQHYGISHVRGSRFRRVLADPGWHRGGLLRHASILTVTSYATRTSPVIRGDWILKNLVGTPTPPPPPDVPALDDNTVDASLPVRQRLAKHRENPSCAVCHDMMDPVGFALENYDAVGRWRQLEQDQPVDSSGGLPDGIRFQGVEGLEKALLQRPELFVTTLTEKLLTYAIGRGTDPYDMRTIRQIVRSASHQNYRLAALIDGIVQSRAFQMRVAQ